MQPPCSFNQSLLSSVEREDDEREEDTELPSASWHPRPLEVSAETYKTTGSVIRIDFVSSTVLCGHVKGRVFFYDVD